MIPSLDAYQEELNQLSDHLWSSSEALDQYIRKYVSVYIEARSKSEQFFPIFCEHQIFLKMLSPNIYSRFQSQTCLLECINLLISNTKTSNQLVYYLSQNCLHQYLFQGNILKHSAQFIEYYVQLIKVLLLKICERENDKSLIQLLCNQKYPNFDIFQYSIVLATCEDNQLVRVTAQQCVLILVGLINQYKIYQGFLSQFGLPSMVTKLLIRAQEFALKKYNEHSQTNCHDQMEEVCKYLVDLIFQLRNSRTALLLLNNIICNVVIIRNIPNHWDVSLKIILSLSTNLCTRIGEEFSELSQPIVDNLLILCATHFRILIKYLTNRFLSATMISNFIQINSEPLADLNSQMFPTPLLHYRALIQMLSQHKFRFSQDRNENQSKQKIKFKDYPKSQSDLIEGDLFYKIRNHAVLFQNSQEFTRIKQSFSKKITEQKIVRVSRKKQTGLFNFLFKKNDWAKKISSLSGTQFIKGKQVNQLFPKCLLPQTSAFINEYAYLTDLIDSGTKISDIKLGQHSSSVEDDEIHSNFIIQYWKFSHKSLQLLNILAEECIIFKRHSLDSFTDDSSVLAQQHTIISKLSVPYYSLFIRQLREYLSEYLYERISTTPKNKDFIERIDSVALFGELCLKLDVKIKQQKYYLKQNNTDYDICFRRVLQQMKIIHQYIQGSLFEGGLTRLAIPFWNLRCEIFHKPKDFKKQIPSMIGNMGNNQKVKEKKQFEDKNRIQTKIDKSMIAIKNKRQSVLSKISEQNTKQQEEANQTIDYFFKRKMILFQCLQKIVAPNVKSMDQHFEQKWSHHSVRSNNIKQNDLFSGFQSQNSTVNLEQTLKEYVVSYFGKSQCQLLFIKKYFSPIIVLVISVHNKQLLELNILLIAQIRKNKIDPKVIQIVEKNQNKNNVQTIRLYNQQQSNELIDTFQKCKEMIQAVFSDTLFGYLAQVHSHMIGEHQFVEKKQKKEKKIKKISIIQKESKIPSLKGKRSSEYEYFQTPKG